jgi:hypothetical protein
MDFQFWLYVIIGVIYFLSRVLKKKEPQPQNDANQPRPERQREVSTPVSERPKPLTFEELLKEITEAKQPQKPVYQPQAYQSQAKPKQDFVDYDDEIVAEEQDLEVIEPDYRKKDKSYYDVYEDAKRQAFERPSLEETMNVTDTDMKFGKFKEFEQVKYRDSPSEYIKDLQDPEGLKKAFVLSEILNRKF